jgi:hypothetical protein
VMLSEKESGVGVRGTVRVPARGMMGSSVRKRQQPPSLERLAIMLRRSRDSVNGPSIGVEGQVAGSGQPGRPPTRGTRRGWSLMIFCARATREKFHVCPAVTHRPSGLVRLVAREKLSRILIPMK